MLTGGCGLASRSSGHTATTTEHGRRADDDDPDRHGRCARPAVPRRRHRSRRLGANESIGSHIAVGGLYRLSCQRPATRLDPPVVVPRVDQSFGRRGGVVGFMGRSPSSQGFDQGLGSVCPAPAGAALIIDLRWGTSGAQDVRRRSARTNAANAGMRCNTTGVAPINACQRTVVAPLKAVAVRIRSGLHIYPRFPGVHRRHACSKFGTSASAHNGYTSQRVPQRPSGRPAHPSWSEGAAKRRRLRAARCRRSNNDAGPAFGSRHGGLEIVTPLREAQPRRCC
jgi:hypothetical protein